MDTTRDSFGEFLAGLSSLFPSALVGASGWERLLALTYRLPMHVADNRFGFEFHLCDPEPAADFCVVPAPGSCLAQFYVREGESAPAGSAAAALGSFLAEQAGDPQALLARAGGGVILEYDLAGACRRHPAPPGIFIVPGDTRDESRTRQLFGDPEPLAAALWAVSGQIPDADVLRQMLRVYRELPPTGAVSQAGIMPGRDQRAVRLIIRTPSSGDAVELLARIRWPGSPAEAAAICESMAGLAGPGATLSVDVTARGVSPRLGLEFYRPVEWHQPDHTGWGRLIDRLAERGWCLPEKAHGLKSWSRVEQVFDRGGVYRVRQTINHVKVIADRGTTTAKAYVGAIVHRAA